MRRREIAAAFMLLASVVVAQDATPPGLLASSRVDCFRVLSVSREAGNPTAVLRKIWDLAPEDDSRAIALEPPRTLRVHVGDQFLDGEVLAIDVTTGEVLVRRQIRDPRIMQPYRDVVLAVRPERTRPPLTTPPLDVSLRRSDAGSVIIDGTTWPACRVTCLHGSTVVAELSAELDGHFQVPLAAADGDVRVVAHGAFGTSERIARPR